MAEKNTQEQNSITVWIVEDSIDLRMELARVINLEEDINCPQTFETAEDALIHLRGAEEAPDVMLMDIQLPGMSGIDAIKRISLKRPEILTVVLTISEKRRTVFDAICAGASGYLLKNDSLKHIVDSIRLVQNGGSPLSGPAASMVLKAFKHITPPSNESELNEREVQILNGLAEGRVKKEIASDLHIATHTVDYHLRNVYTKLQVNSQAGAVGKALRKGLI